MKPRTCRVLAGALIGLTWASGFRAYMVELVGPESVFSWGATFGAVLLPATALGEALGLADDERRNGGAPHWRWLAAAPAAMAIAPLLIPGNFALLLTTGMGAGAPWVVLTGVLGGYAISGRGRRVGRIAAGTVAAALAAGLVATVPVLGGARVALTEPRGAWVAVLALTSVATLALACSIPFRAVMGRAESADRSAQRGALTDSI